MNGSFLINQSSKGSSEIYYSENQFVNYLHSYCSKTNILLVNYNWVGIRELFLQYKPGVRDETASVSTLLITSSHTWVARHNIIDDI